MKPKEKKLHVPSNYSAQKMLSSGTCVEFDSTMEAVTIDFPEDGCDSWAVSYGLEATIKDIEQILRFLKAQRKHVAKRK